MANLPIEIQKTTQSNLSNIDFNNIPFGKTFSDHMLVAEYFDGNWQSVKIMPYGPLPFSPACNVFHYGQAIFEGMKAHYLSDKSGIALFRPEKNWERLNKSAVRMSMPEVPKEIFLDGLKKLIEIDKDFIPKEANSSLYIRPFMIGTEPFIGVRTSDRYLFIILTGPVGAYYSGEVSVLVYESYIRATKGGTGAAKFAGNYAGTLYPVELARKQGYKDVLWLDGEHKKFVQEVGTMNIFFMLDSKLITPEKDGSILEGITRDSVIQIAKDLGITVEERQIDIEEIVEGHKNGKLTEIFGSGTAAVITKVNKFGYQNQDYELDLANYTVSSKIKTILESIQKGTAEDKYNWVIKL